MESIREHGVIQPLIVRKVGESYELIAGERRWRASKALGLTVVPAILREADDLSVLELALIENLQREDLNPVEEALAYRRLGQEFMLTQEEISKRVGRSRAAVANALRLLELEESVRDWLVQNRISVGHAKVLLGLKTPEEQKLVCERVIREGLTVRETEKLVAKTLQRGTAPSTGSSSKSTTGPSLSPHMQRIQNNIRDHFATDVHISHSAKKGKIEITYYGNEDLQRVLELLGVDAE
jgi:ParB family chromosome partitioning protein